jgi:hypothetical protein
MAVGGSIERAAEIEGQTARELAQQETEANRPNQQNPWGSTQWNRVAVRDEDGEPILDSMTGQPMMQWEQLETLNPMLQGSLDAQLGIQQGRSQLAQGVMGRVWNDFQNPMDFSQFGDIIDLEDRSQFDYDFNDARQRAEDAAYQRSLNRLDPQFQAQEQSLLNRLRNQGLSAGDQAYDAALQNFNRGRNDAYEQARLGSTSEGRTEAQNLYNQALQQNQTNFAQGVQQNEIANALRSQGISEAVGQRNYNLADLNNLLSGQLIQGGPPTTGGTTQTVDAQNNTGGLNFSVGGD